MKPLISVIIPAYNHEDFIGEAIDSILVQSCKDFELIIVDDGSTDSTLKRINVYSDPRIKVIEQENRGSAAALNRAVDESAGHYISILNSDDRYHPDRLRILSDILNNNSKIQMVTTGINTINNKGEKATADWLERGIAYYKKSGSMFFAVIRDNFICSTSNFFFRRELFDKIGGYLPLRYCHDLDFILQALVCGEVNYLDEPLLDYRVHGGNTIKESHTEGSEFFKFEVSSVIAYALFQRGLSMQNAPFFMDEVLDTQLGSVLDLVGLVICFFKETGCDRQHFLHFLKNVENPFKFALLKFINERSSKEQQPWAMYQDVLTKYEDKLAVTMSLNKQLKKSEKLILSQGETIAAQEETIIVRENHVAELSQKNESLEEQLLEIYNSRGWLWLTRYRRVSAYARGLVKAFNRSALRRQMAIWVRHVVGDKRNKYHDVSGKDNQYVVKIRHPLKQNRPKIIHAIANTMMGGSTQLVVDLYEHLGHNYDQVVATMFLPEIPAYRDLPVIGFPGLRSAEEFAEFLQKEKADLLHVHYWGECDEDWYRKIFTATELYSCPVVENINIPVSAYLHPSVCWYVFVSKYAATYTESLPENSKVIYPGSHLADFIRGGVDVPDNVIGMVYRLEGDKLNEKSIEVFIEVVKLRPQTRVYIIGGGSFLKLYRNRVKEEGLKDNFEFTGYVPYSELPDYYRKLSLFVAPVWRESFGQVSTFAMSMELPVVGYRVGGVCEMVGSDFCFVEDKSSLADLIVELLNDREHRIEIGKANRKRALELFSVESMVEKYNQVYSGLLKGTQSGKER